MGLAIQIFRSSYIQTDYLSTVVDGPVFKQTLAIVVEFAVWKLYHLLETKLKILSSERSI